MKLINRIIIIFLITIIIASLLFGNTRTNIESFQNDSFSFDIFMINMDKDKDRQANFFSAYSKSDFSDKKINRFSAIVGKNENPSKWLTSDSITKLQQIEKTGYRTHHHDITRGGLGCFLSHYNLAKQLLRDDKIDAYLIFEDDTTVLPFTYNKIKESLKYLPNDWDYVLFYTIRAVGRKENNFFNILKSFWGMNCYIINKTGAKKLVDEVEKNKIDGQIDCYLSKMIQQNKIKIYASNGNYVSCNSKDTNIQTILKQVKGVDPYNYHGYQM